MAAPPKPTDSAAEPRVPTDKITTILMMAAALAAITGFAVLFSLWWQMGVSDPYEKLRIAAQEFVAGRPIVAGELAQTVRFDGESDDVSPFDLPEEAPPSVDPDLVEAAVPASEDTKVDPQQEWIRLRDFLVGAGKIVRAESETDPHERRKMLIAAAKPLEAARDKGFPAGRQTDGYRMLGEVFFKIGRYADAADTLLVATDRDPTLRRELLPIIAESQLRTSGMLLEPALATVSDYLQDVSLRPFQVREGELIRIRALIELQRYKDATEAVQAILQSPLTTDVSQQGEERDFRDEAELLGAIAQVKKAIDRYGPYPKDASEDRSKPAAELAYTIESLGELQREAAPQTSSRARLWLARSYLVQGSFDDGLDRLTAVRQQRPFTPESVLAGVEEIELLARQGRGVEVLQTTRYMMREIGDRSGYDPDAINFDEFEQRLIAAIEELRRNGDFANAIDAARCLPPVFDNADALMQEGIGYREWAEATVRSGTDITGDLARSASILARSRYRASGDAFAQAAQIKFDTADYLSAQWAAIESYQQGRHFRRSIRLLEPYLRYEERRRQPRGLVAYGRALLAEGDVEKAIRAAEACIIEHPRDPLRYDARLLAAQAHAELQETDRASVYLIDNLRDGELTPQSPAWRDSLIRIGEMRYEQAFQNHLAAERADATGRIELMRTNQPILEEAIRYLEEAVERYQLPEALNPAYLAARAHSLAAEWPRIEAESPEILEAAKRSLRAQADQELQLAYESFVRLRENLTNREEETRLPIKAEAILRNCYIAEADTLRQMDRLEDAATAYRTVELRYMNEPPALEAILGRAACAKELGRDDESNLLIRQASIVLSRIPAEWDGRFAETTRFDRPGWEKYLTWMTNRISSGGA